MNNSLNRESLHELSAILGYFELFGGSLQQKSIRHGKVMELLKLERKQLH